MGCNCKKKSKLKENKKPTKVLYIYIEKINYVIEYRNI